MATYDVGTAEEIEQQRTPGPMDLTSRLRATLSIKPGQVVRIHRVGKMCYRVNWFTPENKQADGINLTHYRITDSRFYQVEDLGTQLRVIDKTIREPSLN